MGYESQVIFWVHKSVVGRLLTVTNQNKEAFNMLFQYANLEKDGSGNMKFSFDSIKWYESYEWVTAIGDFMSDLEREDLEYEFGFHRLGEEMGDYEQRGLSELYEAHPTQSLECYSYG